MAAASSSSSAAAGHIAPPASPACASGGYATAVGSRGAEGTHVNSALNKAMIVEEVEEEEAFASPLAKNLASSAHSSSSTMLTSNNTIREGGTASQGGAAPSNARSVAERIAKAIQDAPTHFPVHDFHQVLQMSDEWKHALMERDFSWPRQVRKKRGEGERREGS